MDQSGIKHEFQVLQRMFEQLPSDLCKLLTDQLNIVVQLINTHNSVVCDHVNEQLDDIRLAVKTMEFDLEATRNEKEMLIEKLRDAGFSE